VTIGELLPQWPERLHAVRLDDLHKAVVTDKHLASILAFASCSEHVEILRRLYPEYVWDRHLEIAFRTLSQVGFVRHVLDREDDEAHRLIKSAYHAAKLGKETR
jgi:hypothetical protein